MQPRPDHGETSYKGSGKLKGMKAVITGGDSGIGRAVAIAFAREGADVLIAFLDETEEANEVKKLVEKEGRKRASGPSSRRRVAQGLPVVDPLASPRAGAVTRISCPWRKARDAAATAASNAASFVS
jgi:NAD(P)-dependent dehydrogenase (short-subunit alcohol dehydrogenase family)